VRGDVAHRPEGARGRPAPIVGGQATEQPDELRVKRGEPVEHENGLERTERGGGGHARNVAGNLPAAKSALTPSMNHPHISPFETISHLNFRMF
jgi:hypothetical protein